MIWGRTGDAVSLTGARTASEIKKIPGMDARSLTMLRNFYRHAASDTGKKATGTDTAPARVVLLEDMINKVLGG
jgi:hypothetical protein